MIYSDRRKTSIDVVAWLVQRKFTIPSTDPPLKFIVERLLLVAVLKLVIFPVSLNIISETFLETLSPLNELRNYGDR